jgi:hypothetical protein
MGHGRGLGAPASGRGTAAVPPSHVVAVVGGALDATVVDLAVTLTRQSRSCLDLLVLAEAPALFPLRIFGEHVLAPAAEKALDRAERSCAEVPGESQIVLCRDMASALVAEIRARGATDVVVSAPTGSWWRQWRMRRAISRLRARAACRVYVVHMPLSEKEEARLMATAIPGAPLGSDGA